MFVRGRLTVLATLDRARFSGNPLKYEDQGSGRECKTPPGPEQRN